MKKSFLVFIFALAASLLHAAERKPNVVILLADDLRPDGLHALGNPTVQTPHLDSLVSRGFIFRHAYTMGSMVGAVCLPSRTMLLTGQSMFHAANEASSGPDALTFPRAMREAGYAAIHSGKFGNSPRKITNEFDETYDAGHSDQDADKVIDFIGRTGGKKPLFIYYAPHEPHDPQFATEEFYAKYRPEDMPLPAAFSPFHPFNNGAMTIRDENTLPWPRTNANVSHKLARYCASTSYYDAQVGRILATLRATGQFDNTIFIIAGDNGLSLGEHGLLGKQNLYEFGGMHVPLTFAGQGIARGETRALAYLMDIFPTVCELTGTATPNRVEGRSLAPVMRNEVPRVREYLHTAYAKVQRAIRDERWKLIRYPEIDKTQLFDLQTDPHEMNDLSAQPGSAERIKALTAQLEQAQHAVDDPVPLTVPNPGPAEWSPALLTPKNIEAQEKETKINGN
ncbi:MAG: sulfatase-like hydrolase/transferase [Chthoniobacter sp.]